MSPCSFWPPPPSTSVALTRNPLPAQAAGAHQRCKSNRDRTGGGGLPCATLVPDWPRVSTWLRRDDSTRSLERRRCAQAPIERWSSLYPDAANLRWLTLARKMPLPHPGRYRVFLIAVTDLPLESSAIAPIWNEDTVMDGPGVSSQESVPIAIRGSRDLSGYRVGVYVYQYEREEDEAQGQSSASGAAWSAAAQLRAAGLSRLVESPLVDAH